MSSRKVKPVTKVAKVSKVAAKPKKATIAKKVTVTKPKQTSRKQEPVPAYVRLEHLIDRFFATICPDIKPTSLLDVGGAPGVVGLERWRDLGVKEVCVMDLVAKTLPEDVELVVGDGQQARVAFGENSFDVVQACEVLEHLPKKDGASFLQALCDTARFFAIISTPNGFKAQAAHADNPHQEHLSGWTAEELTALGWKVHRNGPDKLVAYRRI